MIKTLCLALTCISAVPALAAVQTSAPKVEDHIQYSTPPAWVQPLTLQAPERIPEAQLMDGLYYLLVDRQVRVPDQAPEEAYYHYATYIANEAGVEAGGQITIDFDPLYEHLALHRIQRIRDGQVVDLLHQADISLLRRETQLENLLYDGQLSANIILPDVRVGDIVEYSYSFTGSNPVYAGTFSYYFNMQWAMPVAAQRFRLLWERPDEVSVHRLNGAIEPRIVEKAGVTEYLFELEASQPLLTNTQKPSWFDPYQQVVLTDSESWSDVVEWALPLYANAISDSGEVVAVANAIASEYPAKEEQIRAALAFVQNEVRYLGLEMGENSHKPSGADETLARRYGDCKDKAVLFISLLKALDIESHPALVSTDIRHQLLDHPPTAYAFDHVIVRVVHEGEPLWLDPTRQHQKGALNKIAQSDYGYALVVKPGVTALEAMEVDPLGSVEVTDKFDFSSGMESPASYTTTTRYTGFEAEGMLYTLSRESIESISTDYLNFYKKQYAELESAKLMEVKEEDGGAAVTVTEYYTLASAWGAVESGQKEFFVHANMAHDALVQVDERQRNTPLNLSHPHRVSQQINIRLDDREWDISDTDFVEANDYFTYRSLVDFDEKENLLQLRYEYTSHRDHVPVNGISDYLAAYDRADDNTGYSLYVDSPAAVEGFDPFLVGMAVVVAFYLAAAAVVWFIVRKKLREHSGESAFHPIALPKFIALSVVTFGIYPYYWMYRAWRYIKSQDNADIFPFVRTFFSLFWFHSLAERIIFGKESSERGLLPKSTMLLAILTIIYIISLIVQNVDEWVWVILATATTTAILVLLVYHVNRLPVNQGEEQARNSRLGWRHLVLLLMCAPLWLITVGTEARLIPSTKVVAGDTLLWRDVKFMQRAGLLDADEKLLLFYSDAFLDATKDGNALTDRGVFSYWKGENGQLYSEAAVFENIASFQLENESSREGTTMLSVRRDDGSDFVLYLSTEEDGHNRFYKELEKRWQAAKLDQERR